MTEDTSPTKRQRMPELEDSEAIRTFLMKGIASCHQSPEIKMTPDTYMSLYTAVSTLVADKTYQDARLHAHYIYKDTSTFLAEHLRSVAEKIKSQNETSLLGAYFDEWDRFASCAEKVDRILNYINRHYIKRSTDGGHKGIYPIRLLHFVKWRSEVWEKISSRVVDCARQAVLENGVNASRVKDMIQEFERHGLESLGIQSWEELARHSFEAPFVLEVKQLEKKVASVAPHAND